MPSFSARRDQRRVEAAAPPLRHLLGVEDLRLLVLERRPQRPREVEHLAARPPGALEQAADRLEVEAVGLELLDQLDPRPGAPRRSSPCARGPRAAAPARATGARGCCARSSPCAGRARRSSSTPSRRRRSARLRLSVSSVTADRTSTMFHQTMLRSAPARGIHRRMTPRLPAPARDPPGPPGRLPDGRRGPADRPAPRDHLALGRLARGDGRPRRPLHRGRPRPARARALGEAARRLLARRLRQRRPRPARRARLRARDRSSATRSAAGSRSSSPTSSPSTASAWCWSPAAAWARRSSPLLRAARFRAPSSSCR